MRDREKKEYRCHRHRIPFAKAPIRGDAERDRDRNGGEDHAGDYRAQPSGDRRGADIGVRGAGEYEAEGRMEAGMAGESVPYVSQDTAATLPFVRVTQLIMHRSLSAVSRKQNVTSYHGRRSPAIF